MWRGLALLERQRTVLGWLLLSLCLTIVGLAMAAGEAAPKASAAAHPFAQHLEDKRSWFALEGTVEERLSAGPYVYLRVRDNDRDAWVVALSATTTEGRHVRVTVLGQASSFRSARLGREFARLLFGIVRPAAAQ